MTIIVFTFKNYFDFTSFYHTVKITIKENETVKVKSQSHVGHILWFEGHHSQKLLVTKPDNQSASHQGDPAAYALLNRKIYFTPLKFQIFIYGINKQE